MRVFSLFIALFLFVYSSPASGQAADGILIGSVSDPGGAAVPEATIELVNTETNVKYTTKTDESGQYRFNNIPVGRYRVTASATGFQQQAVQNLAIELNRVATVNIGLQIGQVATTVEVVEATATIDTTTANITNNFGSRQAIEIPLTGSGALGVINLSLLNAGVTSSGGVGYGTGPSVGGQRPTNNNFMVEGIDNNNRSVTGPIINVPNEAVSEFSLQQNQFSPEFGHSTGGQFNTVVKSGTNEFHGAAYEYFQNKMLNAVDESFARAGIRNSPRFDQNRFGGNLGGPVLRDKWFVFGNLQYTPNGLASTASGAIFVPTAQGISTLENMPGVNKTNLDVFKQFVSPAAAQSGNRTATVMGTQIPLGTFSAVAPSYSNTWDYLISSDYNISEKDQIRARYFYNRQSGLDTAANVPTFFTPVKITGHLANLTWFHTLSPTLTNELRLGYNRRVEDRPIGDWSFPGLDAFPNLTFLDLGLGIGPNQNYPQGTRANAYQLSNNVNWIKGRHVMKFGYDGRKLNSSNFFVQRQRGDYRYNTLERYLTDLTPEFAERSVGGFPFVGNLFSHYFFANDEIKLRSNLTLSLGLRYEWIGVPTGAKQQSLNALSSVPGLITFGEPQSTKTDFAPRVGIAYSPGKDGKTSIRAGFGMAYDQIYQNLGTNSLPPQFFTTVDAHIDRPGQPNFLTGGGIPGTALPITDAATARRLTTAFIPDQTRPYSLQWNFGVQRVLFNDYTVDVRYLGSRGVHLPLQIQLNRPSAIATTGLNVPVFTSRPSQAEIDALPLTVRQIQTTAPVDPMVAAGFVNPVTAFLPQGNSTYHGLAVQVNKRFSRGFQMVGAYTWSHNIDDGTATLNSTLIAPRRPEDFNNLTRERASSALDRRHRFSVSGIYETQWLKASPNWLVKNIVGNWTLSGTYIAETGMWGTVQSGVDSNLNGDPVSDRTLINPDGDPTRSSGVTPLCRGTGACGTANTDRIVGWLVNDPSARYIAAGQGVMPNGGRNTVRLPGINNFDLAASKTIRFTESRYLELRGEFYNAFNHPQYVAGFPSIANSRARTTTSTLNMLLAGNPNFLRPDLAFQSNARFGQLVARFVF